MQPSEDLNPFFRHLFWYCFVLFVRILFFKVQLFEVTTVNKTRIAAITKIVFMTFTVYENAKVNDAVGCVDNKRIKFFDELIAGIIRLHFQYGSTLIIRGL
jgi:hypothetical protein